MTNIDFFTYPLFQVMPKHNMRKDNLTFLQLILENLKQILTLSTEFLKAL